ncbi:uncharacterized protein [Narcine bancroftii]|uniref:uncharacterized protein isoform X2 n=1 Tax=Narcine bancroftii TaxID=1343680 RepID=UPI0038314670
MTPRLLPLPPPSSRDLTFFPTTSWRCGTSLQSELGLVLKIQHGACTDENTVRDASNEQMAISDTDQFHSFLEVEHNSCRYKMEPREQMPSPVSLESDFFVSLKLAAVLTFIFVVVTILLVSSKQNEPILMHPGLSKFNYQHSLNQKLHKVQLFFPRQSDSFWAALENIFNQLPMNPAESLQARFIGVGHGDSWNTMLCLSKAIVNLLRVSDADLSPDGMNKMPDYSQVFWSHCGSSLRPGTSNVLIAEIVRNHSCTVALSLHAATKPTAAATSLISVWCIKAEPLQEIFPSLVAKVLHHLNQTLSSNTNIPNTPVVTVNPEDHLQSGFLC